MKHFRTSEQLDPGMFSWPFSRPLSSTLDPYSVELLAASQVFPVARRIFLPLLLEIYVSTILLSDAQRHPGSTGWSVGETSSARVWWLVLRERNGIGA